MQEQGIKQVFLQENVVKILGHKGSLKKSVFQRAI